MKRKVKDNSGNGSKELDKKAKKQRIASIGDTDPEDRYPEMRYYLDQSKSDVFFDINGQIVPAIRSVLALKGVVLDDILSQNSTVNEFTIEYITPEAFKTVIRYMFTEELVISDAEDLEVIGDALHSAQYLRVNRLVDAIVQHLQPMIDVKTMARIADMAAVCGVPALRDVLGTHLGAILTVKNMVQVFKVMVKYELFNDQFMAQLKAFLANNLDKISRKKWSKWLQIRANAGPIIYWQINEIVFQSLCAKLVPYCDH